MHRRITIDFNGFGIRFAGTKPLNRDVMLPINEQKRTMQ